MISSTTGNIFKKLFESRGIPQGKPRVILVPLNISWTREVTIEQRRTLKLR